MTDSLKQEAERRMEQAAGPESPDYIQFDDAVAVAVEITNEHTEQYVKLAVKAERERFRAKFQEMLDAYPEDIFIPPPPGKHGDTVDACSAAMGRHIAKMLLGFVDAIRNESKPPNPCTCGGMHWQSYFHKKDCPLCGPESKPPDNPGKTHFYGDGCDEEHGKRPCERCGGSGKYVPTGGYSYPCPDCKPQEEK